MGQRLPVWVAVLLVVLGISIPHASAKASWKYCSPTADYKVSVKGVSVDPDPVVKGSDAVFEIPAVTSEPINGGTVIIEVFYIGIRVHTEKDDLCKKTSCPIVPGEFKISSSEGLPGYTPTGSYRLDMRMQNEAGDLLTCVRINFRITGSAPKLQ